MVKYCPNCGVENVDAAKFCKSCGESLKSGPSTGTVEEKSNRNLLIICATVIICALIIAGAFLVMGNNPGSSTDSEVIADSSSNDSGAVIDNSTSDSPSTKSADYSKRYENFSASEWDQSTYTLDEIYTAHTPEDEKARMFNKADANGDGILTGDEIKEMDYLLKHSDYTYNGPDLGIYSGTISTGSSKSDKTYCSVYVGSGHAGESVKISVLYSRDGTALNQGNIVPKTVDNDGYVSVPSAYAFDKYPDNAFISLYDSNGNTIDTKTVYLDTTSGAQSF